MAALLEQLSRGICDVFEACWTEQCPTKPARHDDNDLRFDATRGSTRVELGLRLSSGEVREAVYGKPMGLQLDPRIWGDTETVRR
jgi:hypothetical protein